MAFARTHALVMTAPDDPAFENNPSDWNEDHSVSGADVGGIPYCPTATTETTSAKFIFNDTTLVLAMGTVTAAPGAISITQTRNAAGTTFDGVIKAVVTDTASAAGSLAMQILGGASGTTNLISVSKNGVVLSRGFDITSGGTQVPISGMYQPGPGRTAITSDSSGTGVIVAEFVQSVGIRLGDKVLSLGSNSTVTDCGLSRISAGLIGVGTGAAASFAGRFKFTSGIAAAVAVGALNAAPTVGEIQSVNDALAPVAGAAVAAGGAANALVWYNGAQWTVIGV